jgi:hypothetical protein
MCAIFLRILPKRPSGLAKIDAAGDADGSLRTIWESSVLHEA